MDCSDLTDNLLQQPTNNHFYLIKILLNLDWRSQDVSLFLNINLPALSQYETSMPVSSIAPCIVPVLSLNISHTTSKLNNFQPFFCHRGAIKQDIPTEAGESATIYYRLAPLLTTMKLLFYTKQSKVCLFIRDMHVTCIHEKSLALMLMKSTLFIKLPVMYVVNWINWKL